MTIHEKLIRQAATPAEQRYLDLYADVAERLPGANAPEVRAWRETGLDQFALIGLPHRRVEEWKYTDLRVLMPEVYPLAGAERGKARQVDLKKALGEKLAGLDAYRAVFVDGEFNPQLSTAQNAPGVTLKPLRARLEEGSVPDSVASLAILDRDPVAALSTAFATDGALVTVEPGVKLEKPLHLIFVRAGNSPSLSAAINAISVGGGAEFSLVETYAEATPNQTFALTRLAIGAGAKVQHTRITSGPGKHLSTVAAVLGAEVEYDPIQVTLDGALTRAQSFIRFAGEATRCHYSGAMLLRGREHGDCTLVIDHDAVGCESRELVKAVLDERGHGVFQGKVIVQRGAQKTDGKQMANALLLSDDAEFDSKPELEIYADDVACGHGATAGQLDEDLLFYLRARGIPEREARALLIASFVGEVLDKVQHEGLREALQEKVDAWLAGGG
jgi:Fe-S cluster assembly protein SufD